MGCGRGCDILRELRLSRTKKEWPVEEGAEPAETSIKCGGEKITAMREWREETQLPTQGLTLTDASSGVHVDKWNCYYFMARWDRTKLPFSNFETSAGYIQPSNVVGVSMSWMITDDPRDPDPIVKAHWIECHEALAHRMLSYAREQILSKTLVFCWFGTRV